MQKLLKKCLIRLSVAVLVCFAAVSCNKVGEIGISSCDVVSISPQGLRSVDMVLSVGIHNPTRAFTVNGISGNVHDSDQVIANLSGGPVSVEKKSDLKYEIPCSVSMEGKLSLFEVLNLVKTMDFSKYFLDVTADVTVSKGLKKTLKYKDLSISELLEGSGIITKRKNE